MHFIPSIGEFVAALPVAELVAHNQLHAFEQLQRAVYRCEPRRFPTGPDGLPYLIGAQVRFAALQHGDHRKAGARDAVPPLSKVCRRIPATPWRRRYFIESHFQLYDIETAVSRGFR